MVDEQKGVVGADTVTPRTPDSDATLVVYLTKMLSGSETAVYVCTKPLLAHPGRALRFLSVILTPSSCIWVQDSNSSAAQPTGTTKGRNVTIVHDTKLHICVPFPRPLLLGAANRKGDYFKRSWTA